MVSCTSVEQSHAKTSRIEETHASKQQEQSIPMNSLSEEFIQIDGVKWNEFLAWNIPKRKKVLERHRELDRELMEQFIGFFLLEPSQILSGWVIYTEEATNSDVSIP